jgi:hypothetical protein
VKFVRSLAIHAGRDRKTRIFGISCLGSFLCNPPRRNALLDYGKIIEKRFEIKASSSFAHHKHDFAMLLKKQQGIILLTRNNH